MFWTARARRRSEKRTKSAKGTSGAPWPPAATSRGRKSATVVMPVRSAMTDGSPICSVDRTSVRPNRRPSGMWYTVWPCEPTRSIVASGMPARRARRTRAAAKTSPRTKLAWQRSSRRAVAGSNRRKTCRLSAGGYGYVPNARTSMPRGAMSTMATSTPSAEVPDIRPATRRLRRAKPLPSRSVKAVLLLRPSLSHVSWEAWPAGRVPQAGERPDDRHPHRDTSPIKGEGEQRQCMHKAAARQG